MRVNSWCCERSRHCESRVRMRTIWDLWLQLRVPPGVYVRRSQALRVGYLQVCVFESAGAQSI